MIELKETKIENYKGLYSNNFKGNTYQVYDDTDEIGFVLLELFEIEASKQGTYHTFILPSKRTYNRARELLKEIFSLAFNNLKLDKLYTLADKIPELYFNKTKRMVNENRKILGYTVFSLTKEGYQCQ